MDKLLPANENLEGTVGYQLQLASTAFLATFVQATGQVSIRRIQFALLAVIGENPEIRQGEAGERLGIQRANLVPLIKDLVDKGLVERRVASDDRRALALGLTDLGKKRLDAGFKRISEHEDEMLKNFTRSERATLMRLLRKITRPPK